MKESVAAGVLLTVLLFAVSWLHAWQEKSEDPAEIPQTHSIEAQTIQSQPSGLKDRDIALRAKIDGVVQNITMADYLPGVIRGEMPPDFELEALKAQAVAERTYICYQMAKAAKAAHPDADVCDNAGCCSAYLSEEEARQKWGDRFAACEERVQAAVQGTDGAVMLYEGEPIMAVFHSSSAGKTAACGDVWLADLPYLISVDSPETADSVPEYYSVKTMTLASFQQIFTAAYPSADFSGAWITDRVEDSSGRVESLSVGGIPISGNEMRRLYGLRSTSFTVDVGEEITFHVTGYGHGVGMSQYGAEELAKQGKSWQEILQWYYTDIRIGGYTNR